MQEPVTDYAEMEQGNERPARDAGIDWRARAMHSEARVASLTEENQVYMLCKASCITARTAS